MKTHAGFLEAINADPDDDAPRLIYADWLEDNGEDERAEFIRDQCRAASLPACNERDELEDRAEDLLRQHRQTWIAPLTRGERPEFHRGFLERIQMTPRQFPQQAKALFELGPACTPGLFLNRSRSRLDRMLATPAGQRVTGLHLMDASPSTIDQLGDLPHLRRLELSNRDTGERRTAAAREALGRMMQRPWFRQLRVLRISGWPFGDEEVQTLTEMDGAPRLRGLVLRDTGLTGTGLQTLASSPSMSRLEVLGMDHRSLNATDLAKLASSSNLGALRALCLEWVGAPELLTALCPLLVRVEWLSLCASSPGNAGLRVLSSLKTPLRLDTLILRQCGKVTPAAMRQFAMSPLGQRLRVLDLGAAGGFTDAMLRGLLEEGGLSQLRGLSLAGNPPLGENAAQILADWPGFRNLRWIDLAGTGIKGKTLCELIASSRSDHLVRARIDTESLSGAELLRLLSGPGVGKMVEMALNCRRCSAADLRAVAKLLPLPRLMGLDLQGVTDESALNALQGSPFFSNLQQPLASTRNPRISWVKRNCALNILGPADEEY
jgi:uncharacterized protein (TIGR02996 family)